jgi:hypothetical protein
VIFKDHHRWNKQASFCEVSFKMETDITPRKKEKPEETQSFKSLVYSNLSDTADVVITDFRTRGLNIAFFAKSKKKSKRKA